MAQVCCSLVVRAPFKNVIGVVHSVDGRPACVENRNGHEGLYDYQKSFYLYDLLLWGKV